MLRSSMIKEGSSSLLLVLRYLIASSTSWKQTRSALVPESANDSLKKMQSSESSSMYTIFKLVVMLTGYVLVAYKFTNSTLFSLYRSSLLVHRYFYGVKSTYALPYVD